MRRRADRRFRLPPFKAEPVAKALSETIDWGLEQSGIKNTWKQTKGDGVRVAVLDTGIDRDHPDLESAIEAYANFTASPFDADRNGHGTHCAGTVGARANGAGVIGVAPACRILGGKVLDDAGAGTERAIARGFDWARELQADIISGSFGSHHDSPIIAAAVRRAVQAGIFVIMAAGNDGLPNSVNFPARLPETIAVAAVDRFGQVAPFSSRGMQVDIAAPGVDILSTWLRGTHALSSGTSMATPFVAGVVALLVAKHRLRGGLTPIKSTDDLRAHLRRCVRDLDAPGHDHGSGWGLLLPEQFIGAAEPAAGETFSLRIPGTNWSISMPADPRHSVSMGPSRRSSP